ncbi:hypothetical protein Glove_274g35 [Diversispora epigaea]|uniref:Uncharacterized protein n=1 Tax=Diversispora epigaea TaxID=1348612 RepID=A0A397IAR3_9GLOM|nr:hypothetical protein Glove_274g35 [Diversispora epigaea]
MYEKKYMIICQKHKWAINVNYYIKKLSIKGIKKWFRLVFGVCNLVNFADCTADIRNVLLVSGPFIRKSVRRRETSSNGNFLPEEEWP